MDDPVLEAAREIRPFLTGLVGPHAAAELDQRIAELLASAPASADAVTSLRTLLDSDRATSRFLATVLEDAPEYRPPRWQPPSALRSPGALPGDLLPMHAGKYGCPRGDYTWYRPDVGTDIPDCPTHRIVLIRAG